MYELDKYDLKIVKLLMKDGRMSASEIAREIGDLSERSIRYRIERMIQDGLVRIGAIVNPKALGFEVIADVWLEVESGYIQEVAQKISEYDCVSYVATSIGEKDVSVQIYARDNREVYNFVTEILGRIPGVRKTVTSIVPIVLKDVYDWGIPTSLGS
jgi:Lrp/AsnC family transcriptional regulator, regulator for asnA, asnC and gidA